MFFPSPTPKQEDTLQTLHIQAREDAGCNLSNNGWTKVSRLKEGWCKHSQDLSTFLASVVIPHPTWFKPALVT